MTENPVKIYLGRNDSLCYLCSNCNDSCDWVRNADNPPPEYVIKAVPRQRRDGGKSCKLYVIRQCEKFEPDMSFAAMCRMCGEKYLIGPGYTVKEDDMICYKCRQEKGITYKRERKPPKQPKPKKTKKPKVFKHKCVFCGKEFESHSNQSRYCSNACRYKAKRIANRDRKRYYDHKERYPEITLKLAAAKLQQELDKKQAELKKEIIRSQKNLKIDYETKRREMQELLAESIRQGEAKKAEELERLRKKLLPEGNKED